jgi:uncharacterized protein (TIGR03067 family)
MTQSRIAIILLIGLCLMPTSATAQPNSLTALDSLQGHWRITTMNGTAIPSTAGEFALVIEGARYRQILRGEVTEEGTLTLDGLTTPMRIDLKITTGVDAGARQLGVFRVEGDTLSLSLNVAGNRERPVAIAGAELRLTAARVPTPRTDAAAAGTSPHDLSGRWWGTFIVTLNGQPQEQTVDMTLVQHGATLTGSLGPHVDIQWKITSGTVDGSRVSIEADVDGATATFSLTLTEGRLTGTAVVVRNGQTMRAQVDVGRSKPPLP